MSGAPNQTVYVKNLNERVKLDELKRSLHALFSQFGSILDIVAAKSLKKRGQAFVVFDNITAATNAINSLQEFVFFDKPMKLAYAKRKSDAAAKADGTFKPRDKKRSLEESDDDETDEPVAKKARKVGPAKPVQAAPAAVEEEKEKEPEPEAPPNKILFLENLPEECESEILDVLFKQFPGFKESRMVTGRAGIAFVEFETSDMAGVAKNGLQDFKMTAQNRMKISFAKQ